MDQTTFEDQNNPDEMPAPGEFINTEEQIVRGADLLDAWHENEDLTDVTLTAAQTHAQLAIADAMERVVQLLEALNANLHNIENDLDRLVNR